MHVSVLDVARGTNKFVYPIDECGDDVYLHGPLEDLRTK
jgi:hypothetical protein